MAGPALPIFLEIRRAHPEIKQGEIAGLRDDSAGVVFPRTRTGCKTVLLPTRRRSSPALPLQQATHQTFADEAASSLVK